MPYDTIVTDVAKNLRWCSCTERAAQRNDSELILTVKTETRHPVRGSFGSEFLGICNSCVVMAAWSYNTRKFCEQFLRFFGKTTLYGKILKILIKMFVWRSTVLCSNIVKFVWREIGEIVRYLPDNKFRLPLKLSPLLGSRPKSARTSPQQCAHNVQILSKSVQFWRSYSRTREHRFLPRRVFPWFSLRPKLCVDSGE